MQGETHHKVQEAHKLTARVFDYTGILLDDIIYSLSDHRIPMIECESLGKASFLRDTHKTLDCNYIFIQPPSVEELSKRIIRNRPGLESKESLKDKMTSAMAEMEKAKRLDWL